MVEAKTVSERWRRWYSVKKSLSARWVLCSLSNILSSLCWCVTVNDLEWVENRVVKTSPYVRVTLEILLQDQHHYSIVSWSVQRHLGEWRVSPCDDPESNWRELKEALAQMTNAIGGHMGAKLVRTCGIKGWHAAVCREKVLLATVFDTVWPVATTKRLLDIGADDARGDHEAKRRKDDATPTLQEPSSGSGVKRSAANIEAIRRADAEAEKALKRARLLDERRAAKRASATPMDELEPMMVAAEAVLTETRETVEALTVSALQQAHAMSHRAETTAESFFQAHKDMTVTTKEQTRKKQLDFLESMKSSRRCTWMMCPLEHTSCPVAGWTL